VIDKNSLLSPRRLFLTARYDPHIVFKELNEERENRLGNENPKGNGCIKTISS